MTIVRVTQPEDQYACIVCDGGQTGMAGLEVDAQTSIQIWEGSGCVQAEHPTKLPLERIALTVLCKSTCAPFGICE